jgi:hypothetical protein
MTLGVTCAQPHKVSKCWNNGWCKPKIESNKNSKIGGKNLNKFLKKNPKKLKYWTMDKNKTTWAKWGKMKKLDNKQKWNKFKKMKLN